MKNFRKKAAPAFVLLAGASMSLAGVTYAWFNQNTKAAVGNINVGVVDASGGIAVSDAIDGIYKTAIDFDTGAAEEKTFGDLDPISANNVLMDSSAAGDNDPIFDFFKGTLSSTDTDKISSKKLGNLGGYETFTLYFENVSGEDRYVFFDYTNLENYNDSKYDALVGEMLPDNKASQYSLRIGFIYVGTAIDKVNSRTGTHSSIIVEPDPMRHTSIANGITQKSGKYEDETYALVGEFYGDASSEKDIRPGEDVPGAMTAQETYYIYDCSIQDPLSQELFVVNPGYTEIKVVIWLEGQDIDNENSVSGLDFSINLNFDTKTEAQLVAAGKTVAKTQISKFATDAKTAVTATDISEAASHNTDIAAIETKYTVASTGNTYCVDNNTTVQGIRDSIKAAETDMERYVADAQFKKFKADKKTAYADIATAIEGVSFDALGPNVTYHSVEEVDAALVSAKAPIELLCYKVHKKTELNNYPSSGYGNDVKTAVENAQTSGCTAIDGAATKADVDEQLRLAKETIDGIIALNQAKVDAKSALDSYHNSEASGQANYATTVATWKENIDNATTVEDVATQLALAKAAIDALIPQA